MKIVRIEEININSHLFTRRIYLHLCRDTTQKLFKVTVAILRYVGISLGYGL